jgi:hypothetical protein
MNACQGDRKGEPPLWSGLDNRFKTVVQRLVMDACQGDREAEPLYGRQTSAKLLYLDHVL